jgi:hypothetical protein
MQFAGTLRKSDAFALPAGQFRFADGARPYSPSRCHEIAQLASPHGPNLIVALQ